ncbi:glycosyltransferase family 2 protein [Novosphingobium sp.]|uniref:glycosyltransferase n=1 Tax=Novosphingobium sp. TaxID=1874826 RepID=UPI00260A199B|nr:glycosyltransferase family 2 protein [Novosphingobium sp.]
MTSPRHDYSVVIPAHNEAAVIERCLRAVMDDPQGMGEIIVACNGCTDDTAAIARRIAPQAKVLEIAKGSKILALNQGNAAASATPRFFVDADIVVSGKALRALAEKLDDSTEIRAAAPALNVDLTGCSAPVRSYYKVWMQQPYVRVGMVGSGFFGLSAKGLEAVGTFPDIIADDLYVRTRFAPEQRARVERDGAGAPISFTVFPPRDLKTLVRIEGRRRAGDMQLDQAHATDHSKRTTTGGTLLSALGKDGVGLIDLGWYMIIKTVGRISARRKVKAKQPIAWARDDSSRVS